MEAEGSLLPFNRNQTNRRWSGQFLPPVLSPDSSEKDDDDMEHEEEPIEPTVEPRRSMRRRISMSLPEPPKAVTKTKKITEKSSLKDIKNYYLDKNVKILNPSLETIFEEPQQVRDEEVVMSTRKYRRSIVFKPTTAKNPPGKVRKRKLKAKQVLANRKYRKVSLKHLMDKLAELSDE